MAKTMAASEYIKRLQGKLTNGVVSPYDLQLLSTILDGVQQAPPDAQTETGGRPAAAAMDAPVTASVESIVKEGTRETVMPIVNQEFVSILGEIDSLRDKVLQLHNLAKASMFLPKEVG